MKKLLVLCLTLVLMLSAASAETILMYGTVVNTEPQAVATTAEAALESVSVSAGDHVSAGDVLATLATQKVYAPEDGTVYLFGTEGNSVVDIAAKYGAVAYLNPAKPYTLTATALDRNGLAVSVLPGETVYLRCYAHGTHTGKGILTKVESGKYTVLVTEGEFTANETVSVYREETFADASRIGRAKITKADVTPCTGEGYLVRFHVKNGAPVAKGTLLYETIAGTFAPGALRLNQIVAPADGVIASVDTENATFELYPDDALRIKAIAPENVLGSLKTGDTVSVRWQYIENMSEPVKGTVEKISRIPQPESTGVEEEYAVYITVEDAGYFYYGMHVDVTAGE